MCAHSFVSFVVEDRCGRLSVLPFVVEDRCGRLSVLPFVPEFRYTLSIVHRDCLKSTQLEMKYITFLTYKLEAKQVKQSAVECLFYLLALSAHALGASLADLLCFSLLCSECVAHQK